MSVSQRRDNIIEDGLLMWIGAVQRTIQCLVRTVVSGQVGRVGKLIYVSLRVGNSIILGEILILSLREVIFSLPLVEPLHVFLVAFLLLADALLYPSCSFRKRI